VHGQHELQGHLLHGQHEHWVKLLHSTVVQGRVKVASVALALFSLLATCVVFWSAVLFSPERMYITLDSSTCTSYPNLKRYKCIWRFGKATGLHELSSFLLSQ